MAVETELPKTKEAKLKAIEAAFESINKEYGKGTLQRITDKPTHVPAIPTGLVSLDYELLGIGGLPKGRIIEILGAESGGKTSLTLQVIAEAQKQGELAAFIDAEHALDPKYAEALGVNVKELIISQPSTGEEALDIVEQLVDCGGVGVIVVDSVAALLPAAELAGDIGDSHVGLQARLMSQACRKLTGKVKKAEVILIFINQIREKIGVTYGSNETSPGGRALRFYSSVRIDVRRIGQAKIGDELVGNKTRIKIVKNKVAPPFKEREYEILWGQGFDKIGDIVQQAIEFGVIEKSGAWFTVDGSRIQGINNVKQYFSDNQEKYNDLYTKVVEKLHEV